MRSPIVRALAWDAFYQVLDNWVFRILAALTLVPVLLTFVLGFREEGIVVLFGLKTWDYAEIFGAFSGGGSFAVGDQQGFLIEFLLQVVFDILAGGLGMLFCIAATAFFVPRMLEKGAAEVLFHKPVSRWMLYLSRYFAGLLFIALVSGLLVGGLYLGLLLVSRHSDPGIFAAAPNLIYVFGLVYSVAMLVGVVTRSTVAATLLTSLFFFFNGCIHNAWIVQQQFAAGLLSGMDFRSEEADPGATGGEVEDKASQEDDPAPESSSTLRTFLLRTLDVLHYILPKTTDADHLGHKLRAAVQAPFHREEGSLVAIYRLPSGIEERPLAALQELALPPALRSALGEPRVFLAGRHLDGTAVNYSLWRRPLAESESKIGNRVRMRRETTSQAGSALEESLRADPDVRDPLRESTRFGTAVSASDAGATLVHWREGPPDGGRTREAVLFKGADSAQLYTLLIDAESELSRERMGELRDRMGSRMGIDLKAVEDWYPSQLGLTAPLRYNILFSIGSSLAFTVLMLLLGWWRLRRIEF